MLKHCLLAITLVLQLGVVSIVEAAINVTSPIAGRTLIPGTNQLIQWTYGAGDATTVKVELYRGNTFTRLIVSSTAVGTGGNGSYSWPVSTTLENASDYKVKVSSLQNSTSAFSPSFRIASHCAPPPFIAGGVAPNVLLILDNSNSMDEDFMGAAVGSYSPAGKSVVAREALLQVLEQFRGKLRIGLMTYALPTSGVSSDHIHNASYFTSYQPKSHCPNPPVECVEFCATGDSGKKTVCEDACKTQNPLFDAGYMDELILNYGHGSEKRTRYCGLLYPKSQSMPNSSSPGHDLYFKGQYPFYASSSYGTGFCWSPAYSPNDGTPRDVYDCYRVKLGTSDAFDGYGTKFWSNVSFHATDSDFALGYNEDWGRRMGWYYVGRTWFNNTSPGGGHLHVPINSLVDINGNTTATYTNIQNKLTTHKNDETGYMSCSSSDKNNCTYVVNAGLTPMAGTLQSAIGYYSKSMDSTVSPVSPITETCQHNYIVYVTDGLPSVAENGTKASAEVLMPAVLSKLESLRSLDVCKRMQSGRCREWLNFDVKTYVLGVGLSDQAKPMLDGMAVKGGTAVQGKAYYADQPGEILDGLTRIFNDIFNRVASGTSVSILSEKVQLGANIMQAVFYPAKQFGQDEVSWPGYLYNYWFYAAKAKANLREDTVHDFILDLINDHVLDFTFSPQTGLLVERWQDTSGDGLPNVLVDSVTLDGLSPLWEAGKILAERPEPSVEKPRTIYTPGTPDAQGAVGLVEFTFDNRSDFAASLGNHSTFGDCLVGADEESSIGNLIGYVRGQDRSGCRNRTYDASPSVQQTWKLGDIVYSTPKIVSNYRFCSNPNETDPSQQFNSTACTTDAQCASDSPYTVCANKQSLVFVGANDGMLHAFKTGVLSSAGLSGKQITRLVGYGLGEEHWAFIPKNSRPYLRCLANPAYCHQGFVDLSPYIYDFGNKKILIGGMRLGGAVCEGDVCNGPWDTCPNKDNCVGLSSYFALDVTNSDNPIFLWEFTHPKLGYSYSGPAIIKKPDTHYVMFLSGPTDREYGIARQNLHAFVLIMDENFRVAADSAVEVFDLGAANSFGGRLFTTGLDVNEDGNTDFVFFGYTQSPNNFSPVDPNMSGGLVKLWPGGVDHDDFDEWEFNTNFLNDAKQPYTAKVEASKCFGKWYLFFGSGKYFYKNDQYSSNQNDRILGVPFYGCNEHNVGTPNQNICSSVNSSPSSNTLRCSDLLDPRNANVGWNWELDPADDVSGYFKERAITDPTVTDFNTIYFTTTQPTTDVCGFGGRSRVWGLNCATGLELFDITCAETGHSVTDSSGVLYLQTSTGAITPLKPTESFKEAQFGPGGRPTQTPTSEWIEGIPPESAPPFVPPSGMRSGRVMHWIER